MQTDNPRGIAAMLASMALFVCSDAVTKTVGQILPLAQVIFIRGMFVTLLLIAVAAAQGKLRYYDTLANRTVLTRGVLEIVGSYAFLASLMHIPLAIAIGINMAAPLAVLPFAVLLLGEQVGWRRWSALAVGFTGVLLIVQPGPHGIDWWVVLALASTLAIALRDVTTRRLPFSTPSILVTAFSAGVLTTTAAMIVLFSEWHPVELWHLAALAAGSAMLGGGMHLLVVATRVGEATVVTGFRYSALVWGVILGYAIWGDLPGPVAWAGIGLIAAAGLYAAHRERVRLAGQRGAHS